MLQTLEGHTSSVFSVAFSPDGKQIVSGSWDNTVRLWDTATGQQIQPTLKGHTNYVSSVAFSPDAKQVVSDDSILLYTSAVSDDWITRNSTNILWLPFDYRTTVTAIHRDSVVLTQPSGRISFFGFSYRSELL